MGEALVDLVVRTDGSIQPFLGGGPFNTARTLGRLDVPVRYLGRLSDDVFGWQLADALTADGVDVSMVITTADPTTLALATLDDAGAASYRFYFEGTSVPGLTAERALAEVRGVDERLEALHVGTLGLVLEPFAAASEAVVEELHGSALVFVDPNIRPAVITDRAGYLTRLDRILSRADVVKVSDEDLAWLVPDTPVETAAKQLIAKGAGLVLVTMGGRGATVVSDSFVADVAAERVTVVDTIGAGDAFAGGVLAWWHDHGRPGLLDRSAACEAAAFGCRVAGATVAKAGANPPRRAELMG